MGSLTDLLYCVVTMLWGTGAHAMGRCHTDRSGYWGPWTNAENTFSNEYFRLLLEERWSPKLTHNGKPWTGPDQYEDSSGQLMMLYVFTYCI